MSFADFFLGYRVSPEELTILKEGDDFEAFKGLVQMKLENCGNPSKVLSDLYRRIGYKNHLHPFLKYVVDADENLSLENYVNLYGLCGWNYELIDYLNKKGYNINKLHTINRLVDTASPVYTLVQIPAIFIARSARTILFLYKRGADITYVDSEGVNLFCVLADIFFDPQCANPRNSSILKGECLTVVKLLLENGVDPRAKICVEENGFPIKRRCISFIDVMTSDEDKVLFKSLEEEYSLENIKGAL